MEPDEYPRMAEAEDRMWWYASLHRRLEAALRRRAPRPCRAVLDAGCGTGGFLRHLERAWAGLDLAGVDLHPEALRIASARCGARILRASVEALPFPDETFDALVSADVLYHADVDPETALRECRRCLRPSGVLVLHVPAYEWMRSYHDTRVHTGRRFTARRVRRLLAGAGLSVLEWTYWNTLLFPAAVMRRKLLGGIRPDTSDVRPCPAPLNALLAGVMRAEEALLRTGLRAPFGLSILAVGRRPG